jgi:hypothetical protein
MRSETCPETLKVEPEETPSSTPINFCLSRRRTRAAELFLSVREKNKLCVNWRTMWCYVSELDNIKICIFGNNYPLEDPRLEYQLGQVAFGIYALSPQVVPSAHDPQRESKCTMGHREELRGSWEWFRNCFEVLRASFHRNVGNLLPLHRHPSHPQRLGSDERELFPVLGGFDLVQMQRLELRKRIINHFTFHMYTVWIMYRCRMQFIRLSDKPNLT